MDIPQARYARRIFFTIVVTLCLLLALLEFVVVPLLFNKPIPSGNFVLTTLILSLLTSILSAALIGGTMFFLVPAERPRTDIRAIPAKETDEVLERARADTTVWVHSGAWARFNRTVTLPELARRARSTNVARFITLCLLDPDDDEACSHYARFRSGLRSEKATQWTARQVRIEILATIISAACWVTEEPMIEITLGLKKVFSMFRIDLSSKVVVITTEDQRNPAVVCDVGGFYYDAYREELRMDLAHSRMLPRDYGRVSFNSLSVANVRHLIENLKIRQDDLSNQEIEKIIEITRKPANPYA